MESRLDVHCVSINLPAQRLDAAGGVHVDMRAVVSLALPLVANSAVQTVLNLTDVWFIGHISMQALAAVGAVQWLVLVVVMLLGGIALAVQPLVAQAYGGRRYRRASQAVWIALWGILCAAPLFLAVGASGREILAPFGFNAQIVDLASQFWLPRVGGATCGMALWAVLSFFNGIGRSRVTALITGITALANERDLYIHSGLGGRRIGFRDNCGAGDWTCGRALCLFAPRIPTSVPNPSDVAPAGEAHLGSA
jgi:MATE family multidrug resistance protein